MSNIEAFDSVLGHHYEGSRDLAHAIQCYERASAAEYAEGNFRDAIMNYSNLCMYLPSKEKSAKVRSYIRKIEAIHCAFVHGWRTLQQVSAIFYILERV